MLCRFVTIVLLNFRCSFVIQLTNCKTWSIETIVLLGASDLQYSPCTKGLTRRHRFRHGRYWVRSLRSLLPKNNSYVDEKKLRVCGMAGRTWQVTVTLIVISGILLRIHFAGKHSPRRSSIQYLSATMRFVVTTTVHSCQTTGKTVITISATCRALFVGHPDMKKHRSSTRLRKMSPV